MRDGGIAVGKGVVGSFQSPRGQSWAMADDIRLSDSSGSVEDGTAQRTLKTIRLDGVAPALSTHRRPLPETAGAETAGSKAVNLFGFSQ